MVCIKDIIALIRVRQWYKNLVILLALVFVGKLFFWSDLLLSLKGFIVLCTVSSGVYVFNDIIDRRKDAMHPEKKNRPIAAGRISVGAGVLIGVMLIIGGLFSAYQLKIGFFGVVLGMILLNLAYTTVLKHIIFADILIIATLFVLRAISGAVLISVVISPWLILCPFFLSVFLSVGKRHGDVALLGEKAGLTREVLRGYTHDITSSLMIISTTLLIMSYALYSFLSGHEFLLVTLPFALFVVFRYYYLISVGSEVARHPEKMWKDVPLVVGGMVFALITGGVLYFSYLLRSLF